MSWSGEDCDVLLLPEVAVLVGGPGRVLDHVVVLQNTAHVQKYRNFAGFLNKNQCGFNDMPTKEMKLS